MQEIVVYEGLGFYYALTEDLAKKALTRLFLPFWKPSGVGVGGELFKRIEMLLIELAAIERLRVVTNSSVLKRLPPGLQNCSVAVKEGLFVHSKVVLVEPYIVYVGSANLTFDRIEAVINHTVRIENPELYLELKAKFDRFFYNQ
jgi:phosphatidylserine/phosphatidylglycerophosphate/cardiolipin synthase-like enzyme